MNKIVGIGGWVLALACALGWSISDTDKQSLKAEVKNVKKWYDEDYKKWEYNAQKHGEQIQFLENRCNALQAHRYMLAMFAPKWLHYDPNTRPEATSNPPKLIIIWHDGKK